MFHCFEYVHCLEPEKCTVVNEFEILLGEGRDSAVELTDSLLTRLLPDVEGVALRLRPARLTTPRDSRNRQVLDVMMKQTLGCEAPVSIGLQAVGARRDAHLASGKFVGFT